MKKLIIIGFILMQISCFAQNLDSGLVGYWPFDGDAKDNSGNGNDGIVNGATLTFDRCGNPNSAYYFNGIDNYIEINDSPPIKSIEKINMISITTWINISNWNGENADPNYFPIFCKLTKSDSRFGWEYIFRINVPIFVAWQDTYWAFCEDSSKLNKWMFVCVTMNKNNITFYLNNLKLCDSTFKNSISFVPTDNTPITIGYSPNGAIEYSNGIIDDLRIYNRKLTDQEVLMLYNMPSKRAKIYTVDTIVNISTDTLYIPIKAKLNCQQMLAENLSFTAKIRFNAYCFYPTGLTKGKIIDNTIDSNFFRNLTIQCDSVNISDTDSILTEIVGIVLLGDSLTPIEITDFKWNNSNIEIDSIINGSLKIIACRPFPFRIQLFTPITLQILPNPANDEIEIKIEGDEEGFFTLNFYNLQGIIAAEKKWYHKKKEKENFQYSLLNIPTGFYQIVLKTPWNVISKPLMIVK